MTAHLDLDGLCDVLAGEGEQAQLGHVADCADCRAALAEIEQAQEPVRAALAALPPPAVPGDLAARLDAALLRERERELRPTLLAGGRSRSARSPSWLLGAAAAAGVVVALSGAAVGVARLSGRGSSSDSTMSSGAAAAPQTTRLTHPVPASSSGTDYAGPAVLAAALPTLLRGVPSPRAAVADPAPDPDDPLGRLRTADGLADCLAGLTGPTASSPVALDYARYAGEPALVVVLPAAAQDSVEVFVVGAACRAGARHTLLHTQLRRAS